MFNKRIEEVAKFNKSVADYVDSMKELIDGNDISRDLYIRFGQPSYKSMLKELNLQDDIDSGNLYKYKNLIGENTTFDSGIQQGFYGSDQSLMEQVKRLSSTNDIDSLGKSTYSSTNNKENILKDMAFADLEGFKELKILYKKAMEDNQMHFSEAGPMQGLIKELGGKGEISNDTQKLLTSIKELIDKQRELTNQMKEVNDNEPTA